MQTIHELLVLVSTRENASFVRDRVVHSINPLPITPLRLHDLHTILLLFYLIRSDGVVHAWVGQKLLNVTFLRVFTSGHFWTMK